MQQLEQDRRQKLIEKVDETVKEYVDTSTDANQFDEKPLFSNMHPASKVFNAILQGKGGTSVGNLTFKNCKRVSPLEKFQYRKKLAIDTVTGNKKFFN